MLEALLPIVRWFNEIDPNCANSSPHCAAHDLKIAKGVRPAPSKQTILDSSLENDPLYMKLN